MPTTRRSPRYTVRTNSDGTVTLTSSDDLVLEVLGQFDSDSLARTYWTYDAPSGRPQPVRQITDERPGTLGQQVCERLSGGGYTLSATPATLASVIRSELRGAMRRHSELLGD